MKVIGIASFITSIALGWGELHRIILLQVVWKLKMSIMQRLIGWTCTPLLALLFALFWQDAVFSLLGPLCIVATLMWWFGTWCSWWSTSCTYSFSCISAGRWVLHLHALCSLFIILLPLPFTVWKQNINAEAQSLVFPSLPKLMITMSSDIWPICMLRIFKQHQDSVFK